MLSFLFEIHFWTLKDEIYISNNDFGTFKYYDKKECNKSLSYEKKKSFASGRSYSWTVSNKKPFKLKQSVKELEESIQCQRIIRVKWLKEDTIVLFFNSGIITYINIDLCSGDICNVNFDKFLKDRLLSPHICDIYMSNIFTICCYNDPQLSLIHYSKSTSKKAYKKLADLEPKFVSVNLAGPSGRRLPRKLCANKTGDVIAVWWKYSENDVFPWSPLVKDIDRANIHIYSVCGSKLEILCYYRTEYDLLCIAFSSVESNVLYAVEQKTSREGDVSLEISTFEIVKCSRLQRANVVSISLQSCVCCIDFSPDRSNLLLGCIDGSLVLFNQTRALTHIVRTVFVPSLVRWHSDGYIVAVASDRGQIQCFDFSLCCVKMQCISEDVTPTSVTDLSVYFTQKSEPHQPILSEMEWNTKSFKNDATDCCLADDSFLFLTFSEGPLVILRIFGTAVVTPEILMTQYLNADQIDKAVNVLLAMDWDTNPNTCASMLKKLTNHIFISSASSPVEKYSQIQMVLGSFYAPVRPICHSIEVEFYKCVRNISRRLFHYLLRFNLTDLAFNVASHLNEHDLFMDLYYYSKLLNNSTLQATAWERAQQIIAEELTANFSSDSENCDCTCSDSSSVSSNECSSLRRTRIQDIPKRIQTGEVNLTEPTVTHLSYASVTRVCSAVSKNVVGNQNIENKRYKTSRKKSVSTDNKTLVGDHTDVDVSQGQNENKINSNHNFSSTSTDTSFAKLSSISNADVCKSIQNNIAQGLLQQTGLMENKIMESKNIKVVHFGVV